MNQMPAWRSVTEEEIQHLERNLPELVNLGMEEGALRCSDILKAVGHDWLINWERKSLSSQARNALICARVEYTPNHKSPICRQGTVILTNNHAKQRRKDILEEKQREQVEKEHQQRLYTERKAEEEESLL